jgi:hypothetical protein
MAGRWKAGGRLQKVGWSKIHPRNAFDFGNLTFQNLPLPSKTFLYLPKIDRKN